MLTAPAVEQRLNVTRAGATNLLAQLEDLGVLRPLSPGPRGLRRWLADDVMKVITEPSSPGRPADATESEAGPA